MHVVNRLTQIEAMLKETPDDPELLYMRAMELVSLGMDLEAAGAFKDLIQGHSEYAPGFHQGARTLVRLSKIDEARSVLRQGIPAALRQDNEHAAAEMQELLESLE